MKRTIQSPADELTPSESCRVPWVGALFLSTALAPALAQEPARAGAEPTSQVGAGLEEVVVTARKREESLLDVPVAVQAFSQQDVERYASSNLTDIGELATQVIMIPNGSGPGASLVVRGIFSSTTDPGVESSVAINLDGLQLTRGRTIRQSTFDVESVEVLKGPQALFFGKDSPAGVVSVRTAGPTPQWEFSGKAAYEFEADERVVDAAVSGPINEKLGVRFAYRGGKSEGWLENAARPQPVQSAFPREPYAFPGALESRLGGYEEHLGRITLHFAATDNFSATMKISGSDDEFESSGSMKEVIGCSRDRPVTAGVVDPDGDCTLNGVTSAGAIPEEVRVRYQGLENLENGSGHNTFDNVMGVLTLNYETERFDLTSVSAANEYDWFRWDNFDGTVWNILGGVEIENYKQVTQELRLLSTFDGPINFMLGGFYEHTSRQADQNGKIAALGPDPATGIANSFSQQSSVKSDSYSVFGQLIWSPVEQFEFAAGARYNREEKDGLISYSYVHTFLRPLFMPVGQVLTPEFRDTHVSPEITARWKLTDETTIYAAYKTGYKAGGVSSPAIVNSRNTDTSVVYQPEETKGGEVGLKFRRLADRLQGTVTVYRYNYDDTQDSIFNAVLTSFEIRNADSQATGFEADLRYLVTDNLALRGQVGYNEAKYRNFPDAPCWAGQTAPEGCSASLDPVTGLPTGPLTQNLSGRTRALAPEWDAAAGFTYDRPILGALRFGFSTDAHYVGAYDTQPPLSPFARQDATWRVNTSVWLADADERWELALIARNLGNERYTGTVIDKPGGARGDVIADVVQPRHIIAQASVRF